MKYGRFLYSFWVLATLWSSWRANEFGLPGSAAFFVLLVIGLIGAIILTDWVWISAATRGKKMLGGEPALRDVNMLLIAGMIVYVFIILALVLGIGCSLVLDTWLPPLVFSATLTVCYAVLVFVVAVISFAESQPNFPRTGDFPPSTFTLFLFILNPIGFIVALGMTAIWDRIMKGCRWQVPNAMGEDVGFLAVLGVVGTVIWCGEVYGLALLLNWISSE